MTSYPSIGIVSGVGPLAGSDILSRVVKNAALLYGAKEDHEYPEAILINHGINGVDNTGKLSTTFKDEIIETVHRLEAAGATTIGIACNTAHVYLPEISVAPTTTILNIVDIVSRAASEQSNEKYLVLTSSASRDAQLYNETLDSYDVSYDLIGEAGQAELDAIIDNIMEYKLEAAGQKMADVLQNAKANGYTAVIAACTELPIAILHAPSIPELNIIDSNEELSKALLAAYYDSEVIE